MMKNRSCLSIILDIDQVFSGEEMEIVQQTGKKSMTVAEATRRRPMSECKGLKK